MENSAMIKRKKNASIVLKLAVSLSALFSLLLNIPAGAEEFKTVLSFQEGINGYQGGSNEVSGDKLLLAADVKHEIDAKEEAEIKAGKRSREELLARYGNYRHMFYWADLDKWSRGKDIKVTSAKVSVYYCDEWWSYCKYTLALHASLDGGKDNIEKAPAGETFIFGDRCAENIRTPIGSWIEFNLRPEVIQKWINDPGSNRGMVLINTRKEDIGGKSEGTYVVFYGNRYGNEQLRPKLEITYTFTGNVAPFAPVLSEPYDGYQVGDKLLARWLRQPVPDLNNDPVTYEIRVGQDEAGTINWKEIAKGVPATNNGFMVTTADLKKGKGCKIGLRASDNRGGASEWVDSRGTFEIVGGNISFNVGAASPIEKIRRERDKMPDIYPTDTVSVSLARGEMEGFQLVLMNVMNHCKGVSVSIGDLKDSKGNTLPSTSITWNPVGYVKTTVPKYPVTYTGWWADPLLPARPFDLEPGKVQPVWVTVKCPRDLPAGQYAGKVTISAAGGESRLVTLAVNVRDFTLPVKGTLKTMSLDAGGSVPEYYGLKAGPEKEKILMAVYDKLCESRLGPGFALCGAGWSAPSYPVKFADGKYDFSEADRLGEYLISRGMNAFAIAKFPKLGSWGFPDKYSEEWKKNWSSLVRAYADHLRQKGWLDMAYAYNIDEAPPGMWEACKRNYLLSKSAAKDLRVMQCLNDPKGVMAMAGYADTWDVGISQYYDSKVSERQKARDDISRYLDSKASEPQAAGDGISEYFDSKVPEERRTGNDEVWWNVCCWPASHPNLFLDYPAIDARIMGWLSYKMNISGFEYWSATSFGKNKLPVDEVEEQDWKANTFGQYNGDGQLLYPGPDQTVLSSIRMEALRDGFEDHEYLIILRDLVKKAKEKGLKPEAIAGAEKLTVVPDEVCQANAQQKQFKYANNPQVILNAREKIAEAIVAVDKLLK